MADFKLALQAFGGGESRSSAIASKSYNLRKEKNISDFEIIKKIG